MSEELTPSQGANPIAPPPKVFKLGFHGDGIDLAIIVLKNILMTVVTLGIYSFWGKVKVRQFIWHNTEFHGHRLTYHGTGIELLRGWMKVIGVVVGLQLLVQGVAFFSPLLGGLVGASLGLVFLFLVPYAIYQSQRYLYSRTTWRGIRFGMAPEAKGFVKAFIQGYLLTLLTLGFYFPVWQNKLYAARMNASRIGTLQVRYTGKDGEAFFMFLRALPLIIVTLGIYFFWYKALVSAYRSEHTWIGSPDLGAARGHFEMTGGDYLKLTILNVICFVFTAGLATPWIMAHNLGFMMKRFAFVGDLAFDRIQQVASAGSEAAEGMADALDVGFGM